MAKPAEVKIRVSTQPVVVMEAGVARKIRQHSRASMKSEVYGVLIGNIDHERMTVEACIADVSTVRGARITFTQDTWEQIHKIKERDFPGHRIVGWYRSHRGRGVFLSEHDLFIQQNFFCHPYQVAWVYDPQTDEEGCFGWVGGDIEKLSAIRIGYSQRVEPNTASGYDDESDDAAMDFWVRSHREKPRRSPRLRRTSLAMGYLAAIVLGFILCLIFLNWRWAPALDKAYQYDHLVEMLKQYQQQRGATGAVVSGPENQRQSSPQQQRTPAEKVNNARH